MPIYGGKMKRYIKSARKISKKQEFKLSDDSVNYVESYLENLLTSLEKREDIDLTLNTSFNSYTKENVIGIDIDDGEIIETDSGFKYQNLYVRSGELELVYPEYIQTKYGSFRLCSDLDSYAPPSRLCQVRVSNTSLDDMVCSIEIGRSKYEMNKDTIDDLGSLVIEAIDRFEEKLNTYAENCVKYTENRAEEEYNAKIERQQKLKDKKYSQPITSKNISKLFTALKQNSSDKIVKKGNYLRVTSYEGDFTAYYDISNIVKNLSDDNVVFGEVLEKPEILLEYADELGSGGARYASDAAYGDFNRGMDTNYGF